MAARLILASLQTFCGVNNISQVAIWLPLSTTL